jgi:hypothetical protein
VVTQTAISTAQRQSPIVSVAASATRSNGVVGRHHALLTTAVKWLKRVGSVTICESRCASLSDADF